MALVAPLIPALVTACDGGEGSSADDAADGDAAEVSTDAATDGATDADIDAAGNNPPLIPTTDCAPTATFQLGTPPVSGLLIAEAGGVIHAAYPDAGGGYWITARTVGGQAVTAPRRIDSTLVPVSLAVNGDRLLLAGGDQVQPVTTAGDVVTPPRAVPCPATGPSCGNHVIPSTGDRFRITWDIPCMGFGCHVGIGTAAAQVLDRDGVPVAPSAPNNAYRYLDSAMAPTGTASVLIEHNAVIGGCLACVRDGLAELSPTGTVTLLGDLPTGEMEGSARGAITHDGTRTYVVYRAGSPSTSAHRVVLARGLTSIDAIDGASDALLIATAPTTGGLVYAADDGAAALARFRDQPGVDPIDRAGACRLPSWPQDVVRADAAHVVTIDADGRARIYALP